MKKAILITGGPGTGKTPLAFKLAKFLAPSKDCDHCKTIRSLRLRPNSKVVIADGVGKLETIREFTELMIEPILVERKNETPFLLEKQPFFIFCSNTVRELPDEMLYQKRIAHLHLTHFDHAIQFFENQFGNLPKEIIQFINEELEKRKTQFLKIPAD